jgi:hypothetical protein
MINTSVGVDLTTIVSEVIQLPAFTSLIKILQTAGIVFIGYLIFLFVQGILQYRRFSRIRHMDNTLDKISHTLSSIETKLTAISRRK